LLLVCLIASHSKSKRTVTLKRRKTNALTASENKKKHNFGPNFCVGIEGRFQEGHELGNDLFPVLAQIQRIANLRSARAFKLHQIGHFGRGFVRSKSNVGVVLFVLNPV
jgi:hypothetical protein